MCNLFLWEVAGKIIGFSQDDELLWGIFHFIEDEKPRPRLIIDDGHESKLDWKSLSIFVKETNEVKVFCVTTSEQWMLIEKTPRQEMRKKSTAFHREYIEIIDQRWKKPPSQEIICPRASNVGGLWNTPSCKRCINSHERRLSRIEQNRFKKA